MSTIQLAYAQVRDRNRVAAAEAERRKDLRRVALEKRRTKVRCLLLVREKTRLPFCLLACSLL